MFVYGAVGLLSAWAYKLVNKGDRSKSFPVLELPIELVEEIVAKLSYEDRCRLACVCSSLRNLADNESFWESLFKQLLPGLAAIIEASKSRWWRHSSWKKRFRKLTSGSRFKCQVFNREVDNAAEDFLLSAYDATASLLSLAGEDGKGGPTFSVQYLPMMRDCVLEQATLDRLRAVPASSRPFRVFKSDLGSIKPGDDVELQWKGMKGHPFGWWLSHVKEVYDDRMVLMFRQYPEHSAWRIVMAPLSGRHEQVVNWDDRYGFIGGIRKLTDEQQQQWMQQVQAVTQMVQPAAAQGAGRSGEEAEQQGAAGQVQGAGQQQGQQLPPAAAQEQEGQQAGAAQQAAQEMHMQHV